MSGMKHRKVRHYTESVFTGVQTRPDFDLIAKSFKTVNQILSKQSFLNADLAAKAMPDSENTDGKKRTSANKKNKLVNLGGIIYDPNQKYEPGKKFKHYVTAEERYMVSFGIGADTPNWGWIDDKKPTIQQVIASKNNKPKVNVTKYTRDMRTGNIIENSGIEIKASPLGQTIRDKNPGGSIMHDAARAGGLVVDALGKFRCPPGTPAANQFTDHLGSNCIGTLAGDTEALMHEVAHFAGQHEAGHLNMRGLASTTGASLNLPNPSVIANTPSSDLLDEIRKQIPNWSPEYEKQVMAFIDMRSRVEEEMKAREKSVETLAATHGVTGLSRDRNGDIFTVLQAMQNAGLISDFDVTGILVAADQDPAYAQILAHLDVKFADPNATLHDKLMGHEQFFVFSYFHSLIDKKGNQLYPSEQDAIKATRKFYEDKANGLNTKEIKTIDSEIQGMWEHQRGFLTGFTQLHLEDPTHSENIQFISKLYDGDELYTHAEAAPQGGGKHLICVNPLDTLNNPPPPKLNFNEALVFSVDPGPPYTDAQKQLAITRAVAQYTFLQDVNRMYAANLPYALGGGQSSTGAQIFWHEFSHTLQWDAIEQELRAQNKNLQNLSNQEVGQIMYKVVTDKTSGFNLDSLTGRTTESLIESRLDAIAGQYSQNMQQDVIRAIVENGEKSTQFQQARRLVELETTADIYSLRRLGVVSGSDIDDALEWMDRQKARPIDWQASIPTQGTSLAPIIAANLKLPTPTNPDGSINVGNPRPGRTSINAQYIREGRLDPDEINMRLWDIQGTPWGQTVGGPSGVRNKFVQDYLKSYFPNQELESLSDDEIVQVSQACLEEAKRLRSLPVPSGPSIDKDKMNGYRDAQNGAKRLDSYADSLQDVIDLRAELIRQTGPNGTPVIHLDANGNKIKPKSPYAGKPGSAHKQFKTAFKKGQMDQETLYELANEHKEDLTEDEYNELIDLADWDPTAEAEKASLDDDSFWSKAADEIPDDPFADEDSTKDPFSPDYIKPEDSSSSIGKDRKSSRTSKRKGLNSAARMHSVTAQRVFTPEEQNAIKDSTSSPRFLNGLASSGSSLDTAIAQSAFRRRVLTDAGIKVEPPKPGQSSTNVLADNHIESYLHPLLEAMDKTPSSKDMAIEVTESDFDGVALKPGFEINHTNFAIGTSPSIDENINKPNRSVLIHIPSGSRVAVQTQGRGKEPKIIIPPGAIKIIKNDGSGDIHAQVVSQQSSSDVLNTLKRKISKASGKMTGDNKRETSKIIDSLDKIIAQKNNRGPIDNKDIVSRQIGQRNSNILLTLKSQGSAPFGAGIKPDDKMPDSQSEIFKSINRRLGTTLGESLDSRHSNYVTRVSNVIKEMKNKDTAVVENPVKFSATTQEVLNQYTDKQINKLISDAGAQIHMGINKNLVVQIDDLSKLGENDGIFRTAENDSIEMLKKQNDILHGFSDSSSHLHRPIQAEVRHFQHDRDIAELLKNKGGANSTPEFYSESSSIKAVLRPETSSRSGYGYKDFSQRDTPVIPITSTNRKLIDTGISDNSKQSDPIVTQQSRLNEILDGAVTGKYTSIVGTKDNPSFMALIPGGINRKEIQHVEYPLSRLDITRDSIKENDGILGRQTISSQLKSMGLTDAEIEKFYNSGGLIGGGPTPPIAMRLMQFREAQNKRNELRKYGIDKVKFVNPEGIDIENPRTWQKDMTATTESAQRLLEKEAVKQVKLHLQNYVQTAVKQRKKAV
jgi:hypothetical protein